MLDFPTKNTDTRLIETARFIEAQNKQASQKLYRWAAHVEPQEFRRIGEKMHIGNGGTKEQRKLKRSIILMRTSILRHDVSKVVREVNATTTNQLQVNFNAILNQAANYVPVIPSSIDFMAAQRGAKIERDQAARIAPRLRGLQAQRRRLAFETYVPFLVNDDSSINKMLDYIRYNLTSGERKNIINHGTQNAFNSLNNGGELYIVGHGNLGRGIGTHSGKLGASELTNQLRLDGLALNPTTPVTIYLFSCWAATHTRKAWGGVGKREPFVRRFARALHQNGFRNHIIVGFAGAVINQNLAQDYVHKPDLGHTGDSNLGKDGMYNIYKVFQGGFNRTHGEDWITKARANGSSWKFLQCHNGSQFYKPSSWSCPGWSTMKVRKRGG
jgi:hypothetical protein